MENIKVSHSRLNVLVIEDSRGDLALILRILSRAQYSGQGFDVSSAMSLAEAFEQVRQASPDVVLLDLNLSDSHGLSTLVAVKDALPNAPVVVLSNVCLEKVALEAVRMGAEDYLFKESLHEGALSRSLHYAVERAQLKRELSAARAEAERASKAKSDFIARLSHEIRNPLSGVIGAVSLLKGRPLGDDVLECLAIIESSGQHILTILNDVLDLSKIESGKMTLDETVVDLRELVREAVRIFAGAARDKDLAIETLVDPSVPSRLVGDGLRIKQIVINFLSNAIKFSENGKIEVKVDLVGSQRGLAQVRFAVSDSSVGMDDECQAQLFSPYFQSESERARAMGTGLGLSIVKQLADMMNGSVGVRSTVGRGSEFWFEACLKRPDGFDQNLVCTDLEPQMALEQLNVLIADDCPVSRLMLRRMLERLGLRADVVCNGQEAIKAVGEGHYDTVFLDCQMPVMDGYRAAEIIRHLRPSTPIIALSGSVLPKEQETARRCGMDEVLAKPVTLSHLQETLRRWSFSLSQAFPDRQEAVV